MQLLTDLGLKQTSSRKAILNFLAQKQKPLDVSSIENYLAKVRINTNQTTIYRILNMFYEKGLVDRLEFKEGKYRYELKGADHHHVVCENCGKIVDISGCSLGKLVSEIKEKTGFSVNRHSLEFFGICKTCQP